MKPSIPYIEVEYIKSSGGAYIDTGLSLSFSSVDWSVDLSFGDNITISQHQFMFGAVYQGNMLGVTQGAFLVLRPGWHTSQGVTSLFSPGDRVVLRLVRDQGLSTLYANGVAVATSGEAPAYNMGTFCLLWSNLTEFAQAYYPYLLHGASSGNGEFDLIPVRFINEQGKSEGAMYDRVTGRLFRNAGTGSFVIGPDKHPQTFTPIMTLHNYPKKNTVPTAKDYIQDGLIAMWDGIENAGWDVHDAEATTWKDLVGERDFSLYDVGVGDNRMVFGSNSYATALPVFQSSDMMTLEVVMEVKSATSAPCFMSFFKPDGYVGDMLWFSNNCLAWGARENSRVSVTSNCAIQGYATWSLSTHSFVRPNMPYKNGEQVAPHSITDYYGASNNKELAINPTTKWTFSGDIYSIRLYSRALTADAIAANYAIDKVRFNLPDPA